MVLKRTRKEKQKLEAFLKYLGTEDSATTSLYKTAIGFHLDPFIWEEMRYACSVPIQPFLQCSWEWGGQWHQELKNRAEYNVQQMDTEMAVPPKSRPPG